MGELGGMGIGHEDGGFTTFLCGLEDIGVWAAIS